ncbi:ferric iron reductase involved in ferric hydroximate transport [compost metagenome]
MSQELDFSLVNSYYHISLKGAGNPLAEIPATDFFEMDLVRGLMRQAGETVQAHGLDLPASFFGTSLCNLCSTKLIFLAQYNKMLDLSLEHLTFQIEVHEDHVHLGYKINQLHYTDVPEEEQETVILKDWETFITHTVTPAVEAIAEAAGVKSAMIWQQFGGVVGMLREFIAQNETRKEVVERFNRNFLLLSESISPELFHRHRNPFKHTIRYTDNPYHEGERLVLRSSCCLYYCRENGEKCYVCPRLKEEEREEKKVKILATL